MLMLSTTGVTSSECTFLALCLNEMALRAHACMSGLVGWRRLVRTPTVAQFNRQLDRLLINLRWDAMHGHAGHHTAKVSTAGPGRPDGSPLTFWSSINMYARYSTPHMAAKGKHCTAFALFYNLHYNLHCHELITSYSSHYKKSSLLPSTRSFAEYQIMTTKQRRALPSARDLVLGKATGTRQRERFM